MVVAHLVDHLDSNFSTTHPDAFKHSSYISYGFNMPFWEELAKKNVWTGHNSWKEDRFQVT